MGEMVGNGLYAFFQIVVNLREFVGQFITKLAPQQAVAGGVDGQLLHPSHEFNFAALGLLHPAVG